LGHLIDDQRGRKDPMDHIETDKILVKRNRTVRQNNTSEVYH